MSSHPIVASSSTSSGGDNSSSYTSSNPTLWAHLLRQPLHRESNVPLGVNGKTIHKAASIPPTHLAPLDKNATSTRILLHDTHTKLESFTERSGKLMTEVEQARSDVNRIGDMFEGEREGLVNDMVRLVNRCQTELQKTIGEPMQHRSLAALDAQLALLLQALHSVKDKLNSIDSKCDSLQMTTQIHTQTLQTLTDQSIRTQEQYSKIISMLSPVLPLLDSLPLRLESTQTIATETMTSKISTILEHQLSQILNPFGSARRASSLDLHSGPLSASTVNASASTSVDSASPHKKRRLNPATPTRTQIRHNFPTTAPSSPPSLIDDHQSSPADTRKQLNLPLQPARVNSPVGGAAGPFSRPMHPAATLANADNTGLPTRPLTQAPVFTSALPRSPSRIAPSAGPCAETGTFSSPTTACLPSAFVSAQFSSMFRPQLSSTSSVDLLEGASKPSTTRASHVPGPTTFGRAVLPAEPLSRSRTKHSGSFRSLATSSPRKQNAVAESGPLPHDKGNEEVIPSTSPQNQELEALRRTPFGAILVNATPNATPPFSLPESNLTRKDSTGLGVDLNESAASPQLPPPPTTTPSLARIPTTSPNVSAADPQVGPPSLRDRRRQGFGGALASTGQKRFLVLDEDSDDDLYA